MSEFYLCSVSCELIDGFLSNFVHASVLINLGITPLHILFYYFWTELWPLIDVKIVLLLIILGMD